MSDDEFDDLFSFGTTQTTVKRDDDDDDDDDIFATSTTPTTNTTTTLNDPKESKTTSSSSSSITNLTTSEASQNHSIDSSSYYKVSSSNHGSSNQGSSNQSSVTTNDDDMEDIFGPSPVDKSSTNGGEEAVISTATMNTNTNNTTTTPADNDDFHTMDEGARDFLEWLDTDTNKGNTQNLTSTTNTQSNNDDDWMDDVIINNVEKSSDDTNDINKATGDQTQTTNRERMEFVDIDVDMDLNANLEDNLNLDQEESHSKPAVASDSTGITETIKSTDTSSSSNTSPVKVSEDIDKSTSSLAAGNSSSSCNMNKSTNSLMTEQPHESIQASIDSTKSETSVNPTTATIANIPNNAPTSQISNNGNTNDNDLLLKDETPPITFDNLSDALRSRESTMNDHIRQFIYTTASNSASTSGTSACNSISSITDDDRPWLWTKAICGKVLTDVKSSSLCDSFVEFYNGFDMDVFTRLCHELSEESGDDPMVNLVSHFDEEFRNRLLLEVGLLSDRVVVSLQTDEPATITTSNEGEEESKKKSIQKDLCSLLLYHYRSKIPDTKSDTKETESLPPKQSVEKVEWNSLLGPITATLLSASIPVSVTSVMLSTIGPASMPLLSLHNKERSNVAKSLHSQLYFLAWYHLPLLVLHLDRNAPGWHWPKENLSVTADKHDDNDSDSGNVTKKSRNLEAHGSLPISWFTSHLAGECCISNITNTEEDNDVSATKTDTRVFMMEPKKLRVLWDILLTNNDHSLKFFLALAILEKHCDELLMLRGQELVEELNGIMSFQQVRTMTIDTFVSDGDNDVRDRSGSDAQGIIYEWYESAKSLQDSTPTSVLKRLSEAENEAVNQALIERQRLVMEEMKIRLEAEADAHRKAVEDESNKKDEEAEQALNKKRLTAFYKKYCPEKSDQVDRILEVYAGRLTLLDMRLQKKYGVGFIPTVPTFNPQLTVKTNKLFSTMGHGIQIKKNEYMAARVESKTKKLLKDHHQQLQPSNEMNHQVALRVSANEILPSIIRGKNSQTSSVSENINRLKYYLVDSRPDETAKVEGRFPTSVSLSPDNLMDPDKIKSIADMFEALRGTVHICIMGEGFSSFSSLYGHNLSESETALQEDDESRTSLCALFFIKRGFPFVSVLDGGFAAAHAWLSRSHDLALPSVLVDYDEESSLFANLERSYEEQQRFANAPARLKTIIAAQRLIDSSMARLTMSEQRFEELTDQLRSEEGRKQVKKSVGKMFTKNPMKGKDRTDNEKDEKQKSKSSVKDDNSTDEMNKGTVSLNERNNVNGEEKKQVDEKKVPRIKVSFGGFKNLGAELSKVNAKMKAAQMKAAEQARKNKAAQQAKENKDSQDDMINDKQKGEKASTKKDSMSQSTNSVPSQQMSFDLSKIKFGIGGKRKNPLMKSKVSDDDLVKEIEATLEETGKDTYVKPSNKPSPKKVAPTRTMPMKFGFGNLTNRREEGQPSNKAIKNLSSASSQENELKKEKQPEKVPLHMQMRFGRFKSGPPPASSFPKVQPIREEELIMFEDDHNTNRETEGSVATSEETNDTVDEQIHVDKLKDFNEDDQSKTVDVVDDTKTEMETLRV